MSEFTESDYEYYEQDLELLVDTLRRCFESEKARYFVIGHTNTLIVELEGLDDFDREEIEEIASPVLEELDLDFDEVTLVPLKN